MLAARSLDKYKLENDQTCPIKVSLEQVEDTCDDLLDLNILNI